MIRTIKRKIARTIKHLVQQGIAAQVDELKVIAGTSLVKQGKQLNSNEINDYEFKIFSQFGEDGIIQYLISNVPITNRKFIEFGVEDFAESNCRFLMMHDNWSGLIFDGSKDHINTIRKQDWFWRYDLIAEQAFITKENVNELLDRSDFYNVGILSVDIDGVDYHVLEAIEMSKLNPAIIIVEYNSIFGPSRAVTVPYDPAFVRKEKHYSNLYWGASLSAYSEVANRKGYVLVGGNKGGNNAFFVRRDLLSDSVKKVSVESAYRLSKYHESLSENGELTFQRGVDRLNVLRDMPVVNVISGEFEKI